MWNVPKCGMWDVPIFGNVIHLNQRLDWLLVGS